MELALVGIGFLFAVLGAITGLLLFLRKKKSFEKKALKIIKKQNLKVSSDGNEIDLVGQIEKEQEKNNEKKVKVKEEKPKKVKVNIQEEKPKKVRVKKKKKVKKK